MYIQHQTIMDSNNTPKRKVTRFSEHPQVFQYSSKSKRDNYSIDNDSLLLDNNIEIQQPQRSLQKQQKLNYNNQENIDFDKKELQLDQLTSQLAEIEAYLNTQSEPIVPLQPQPYQLSQKNKQRISFNPKQQSKPRLSFNVSNGRETLNIQQQTKIKSQLKSIPASNRKDKQPNISYSPQRNIEKQIKQELQNKNRITMDVNSLMNMISSFQREESERKYREQRKNRITLDVFALSKMVQNMDDDTKIQQEVQNQNLVTPMKKSQIQQQSYRKSKVFSAYKNNQSAKQVSLQISKYLAQVNQRIANKNKMCANINKQTSELISEQNKFIIKIQALKQQIKHYQQLLHQKLEYKNRLIKNLQQNDYMKAINNIRKNEYELGFGILKYQREKVQQITISIAHFNIDGIFAKLKAKNSYGAPNSKNSQTRGQKSQQNDLKLMYTRQIKQAQKGFLLSVEQNTKILKKYHYKYLSELKNQGNLLELGHRISKAYQNLRRLDIQIQYLSLNFQSRNFQMNSSLQLLNFDIIWGTSFNLICKVNILSYINNRFDKNSIQIYDVNNHQYLKILDEEIQIQGQIPKFSLLYLAMERLIDKFL